MSPSLRDALRRLTLERALQLAIAATLLTAVLAAGALLSWLEIARRLRWVALLTLVALAVAYAARERGRPQFLGILALGAAFLCLAVVSASWSSAPSLTLSRAAALGLVFVAGAALAWATAGRPDAVERLLTGVLVGVGAVAVGGLLVLLFRYDRAIEPATTVLPARYQGLGGGPNTAMMVLSVGVPLAALAAVEARRRLGRAAAAGLLLLFVGSIVASGSRGALASAFGGLLAFALLAAPDRRRRAVFAGVVVVAFAVGLLITRIPEPLAEPRAISITVGPPSLVVPPPPRRYVDANDVLRLQDDIGRPPPGVGDTERRERTIFGTSGRAEAWEGAVGQGAERPMLGHGFGVEDRVFVDRYVNFNSGVPENSYIGLFLQLGVVGLSLFVALVGALLARAAAASRRLRGRELRIAAACAGGLVVGLLLACFQSFIYAAGNNATAAVWICGFLLAAATATRHAVAGR